MTQRIQKLYLMETTLIFIFLCENLLFHFLTVFDNVRIQSNFMAREGPEITYIFDFSKWNVTPPIWLPIIFVFCTVPSFYQTCLPDF